MTRRDHAMGSHTHLGIRFEVWDNHGAWFWRVVNAGGHTGLIGAAPKQADAEREARSSIEELSSKAAVVGRWEF
jgi:hypothetical protein